MKKTAVLIMLLTALASGSLAGESFQSRIHRADGFLRGGQDEKALKAYQEMLVDYPDAARVIYGIGAAQYMRAEEQAEAGLAEEAAENYRRAEESFTRLTNAEESEVREHAAFNLANCNAGPARLKARDPEAIPPQEWEKTVAQLRAAISRYDNVLRDYPEYEAARQNRLHLRYLLKRVLRNPPPPPEGDSDPPPQPPQNGVSVFTRVETDLDNAEARLNRENDIAELVVGKEGQP